MEEQLYIWQLPRVTLKSFNTCLTQTASQTSTTRTDLTTLLLMMLCGATTARLSRFLKQEKKKGKRYVTSTPQEE